jgi:S-adenosylmethionine synthetase
LGGQERRRRGLADRFEVEVAYGSASAAISFSRRLVRDRTDRPTRRSRTLIERHFDLRPASIIAASTAAADLRQTAAYGHFGRPDLDLRGSGTDKASLSRRPPDSGPAGYRWPPPEPDVVRRAVRRR